MIDIINVKKQFDDIVAVNSVTIRMPEGSVYGLLGTNGAGKSTLLRMLSGVLQADEGEILIDGQPVWENPQIKAEVFYISDDQYFYNNATPTDLAKTYALYYPKFDLERFQKFLAQFCLDARRSVHTFSKGMRKQVSILLGICSGAKYLLCDETFDGLDPVMRKSIKKIFAGEMLERGLTPIIASHNLRELEDICEHVGVLHLGGVLVEEDVDVMKGNLVKLQCVIDDVDQTKLRLMLDIVELEQKGKLITMAVRGREEEVIRIIEELNPTFYEILPLSLEEIFIYEAEGVGYDVQKFLL